MRARSTAVLLLLLRLGLLAAAEGSGQDFSGNWILDQQQGNVGALPIAPGAQLTIVQQDNTVRCTEAGAAWTFRIDGTESKYQLKGSNMNSVTKWEGSALLINTLVNGPHHYVVMDRWKLSKDRALLTVTRTVQQGTTETEVSLVYKNPERLAALPKVAPPKLGQPAPAAAPAAAPARSAAPAAPAEFVIQPGTKIPLGLLNSLNTRHSAEGDRVYLETVFPISQDG